MSLNTVLYASLVVLAATSGCQGKDDQRRGVATTGSATRDAAPRAKIEGPSVTPVITNGVTFVTPKAAGWWAELNFSCYRAVMSLTGTKTAGEAFEKLSPTVPDAMRVAGIDLGRDLAALGAFDCGGSPCIYVAAAVAQPAKFGELLKTLLPASPPIQVATNHYKLETPGMNGTRTIHIRVVPIAWTTPAPSDVWSQQAARATHVVFIGGIDGKNVDLDPLASLADAATGLARVQDAEGVVANANGRCMVGLVGPREFQPGYKVDRARFAMAAPPGQQGDALMTLLGSTRTLGVEIELVLSPAPTASDVKSWIADGRTYLAAIGQNVKSSFAGQGPMVEIYFDMISLIGTRAFEHSVAGKSLRFSWRTDRIPESDLTALERRLGAALGAPPP